MRGSLSRPVSIAWACALVAAALATSASAEDKPSMLHSPPLQAPADKALEVEGSLVNGAKVEKVVVRYRGPAEDYVEVAMEFKYGDLYRASIPAARMTPPGVEYYIEGIGFRGERVPLFMTPGKPARVFVLGQTPDAGPAKKGR